MKRKVLLLEPNYKNKFPPIGLMKLATYFKLRGDDVVFYKGNLKEFVIGQITEECIEKLNSLDSKINWKLRADKIAKYIKYRKHDDLEAIEINKSEYSILIYPWIKYYKNFYHKGEYKKYPKWDWIGVTTLFTFHWDITIETIEFAKTLVKDINNLMIGGVLASIQPKEIEKATGIKPHCGTLSTPGDIDSDNPYIIDELPLDYSILDEIDYIYPDNNAYYSYSTRGCIRHCSFCAVPILEPKYNDYLPLHDRILRTKRLFGEQQNLLLMDNNVLASTYLPTIIEDIKSCGFRKGAKYFEPNHYDIAIRNLRLHINDRAYIRKCFRLLEELNNSKSLKDDVRVEIYALREQYGLLHQNTCTRQAILDSYYLFSSYFNIRNSKIRSFGRIRHVDFNQGVDARLFNEENVRLLSQIPIRPLRIAFDDMHTKSAYINALKLSVKYGMKDFSNYLLYNFKDEPIDLYRRLKINVDLCEELDVSIYSFPMKYHPIREEHSHDRDFIGEHWNRKYIRAIQAILNATKGKVGRGHSFFEKAFGRNEKEYMELLIMPETFIIFRFFFEHLGYTDAWRQEINALTDIEKQDLYPIIFKNDFKNIEDLTDNPKFLSILRYYKNYRNDIADKNSELYNLKQEFDKKNNDQK
ncbi:MAG: hypothetical protein PUB21_04385 [Bacteroidales bacterium]|nr:hypothetical protein [Bacteroidales bacterium]